MTMRRRRKGDLVGPITPRSCRARSKSSAVRPRAKISKTRIYAAAKDLVTELEDIDVEAKSRSITERTAMIYALSSVEDFLRSLGYPGSILYQLYIDLRGLERGSTAPTLKANKKAAGRPPESMDVKQLKGMLAGIARLKQMLG